MIIILKHHDLAPAHYDHPKEDVYLDHFQLSEEIIQQSDLIVFVNGDCIKILSEDPGIQARLAWRYFSVPSSPRAPKHETPGA